MNAERLRAIARELQQELRSGRSVKLLQTLVSALQGIASGQQQQTGKQQQAASQARQELRTNLERAPSNEFSPGWRQHLDELGVDDLVGTALLEQVEEILGRNEITPAAAAEELEEITSRLQALETALQQIADGMDSLGVGIDDLESGEFEIGILIPRGCVNNNLSKLGKEFAAINKLLLPYAELTTGSRPDFKVRSISSSDFCVYLSDAGSAAACVSFVLNHIIEVYHSVQDIKDAWQRLRDNGLSDDQLAPVEREVGQKMNKAIDAVIPDVIEKFGRDGLDTGRQQELTTEIRYSMQGLAERVDAGFHLSVRVGELPDADDEEASDGPPDEEADRRRRNAEIVSDHQSTLQYVNTSGDRILRLKDGSTNQVEDDLPDDE